MYKFHVCLIFHAPYENISSMSKFSCWISNLLESSAIIGFCLFKCIKVRQSRNDFFLIPMFLPKNKRMNSTLQLCWLVFVHFEHTSDKIFKNVTHKLSVFKRYFESEKRWNAIWLQCWQDILRPAYHFLDFMCNFSTRNTSSSKCNWVISSLRSCIQSSYNKVLWLALF